MSTGPDPSKPGGEFREGAGPLPRSAAPLSAEDLITLNEQIVGMAKAGLPLDQGLSALARDEGSSKRNILLASIFLVGAIVILSVASRWITWIAFLNLPVIAILATLWILRLTGSASANLSQVTGRLADDLRAGLTLPQALERQGGRVPPYYAALLSAGIRSGRIGDVLGTLTLYARSLSDFRSIIVSSLLYPLIVLILGSVLLVFIGNFVLPAYVEILDTFKMKLPWISEIVLLIGRHPFKILVLPLVLLVVAVLLERLWLNRTPAGRRLWTSVIYLLPIIGTLIRSARLAAFTDLLGILVEQGIPLPEALRLAAEASSDPLLSEAARRVESDISQGMPLGQAIQSQRLWPALVVWMVGFGEKQGTLPQALRQVAQMYRRAAETRATVLRTVLPPLLTVILAASLGALFIFGLMSPFFELLDGLSGGGGKK